MSDGAPVVAFFPHADGRRWVLWTRSGCHDCSPGGEDLIGSTVNRGKDQEADFFPASRMRSTYYRPDIVSRVPETLDEAASVRLAWAEAGAQAGAGFAIQPELYLLAVGVGSYKEPDFKLDYPAKDARDFSAALLRQKARLYRDVEVKLLADADATRDAVMDGLDWLERQTTAKDVAVLFLAGHGINDEVGAYSFLPWNADPGRAKTTMIPRTASSAPWPSSPARCCCSWTAATAATSSR